MLLTSNVLFSNTEPPNPKPVINQQSREALEISRKHVLELYVKRMQQADYKQVIKLFSDDGVAVSSSGVESPVFNFYKNLFEHLISSPKSKLINIFPGTINSNTYALHFYYTWKNKSNLTVGSEFLDLVQFNQGSDKIRKLMVYSNTFKQEVMKMKK
jgi:hypothetical protein